MSEQKQINAGEGSRKTGACTFVAFDKLAIITAAFNQFGYLLARIAGNALKKAKHDGFTGTLQTTVTETAHRVSDVIVALIVATAKSTVMIPPKRLVVRPGNTAVRRSY
ncbi:MAG: hypothetical protein ABIR84_09710 [Candidatus Nitrotoga sp.]